MSDRIGREVRRAKSEIELGDNPVCAKCGYSQQPRCLKAVKKSLLETHHIFGKANDPEATVILCRNCHGEITESNRDAGISMRKPPNLIQKVITYVSCLEVLFVTLAAACGRIVEELADWARRGSYHEIPLV